MSKNTRHTTLAMIQISGAAAHYKKDAKALADAMEAQRAAQAAASAAQLQLEKSRENLAHIMRHHGHNYVRCEGLLLSVDDEGLAACEDKFTTIAPE